MPRVIPAAAMVSIPLLVAAAGASAQQLPRLLISDRTNDALWVARDRDNDGVIDASEVSLWFDATNADFTLPTDTMASLAVRRDGFTLVGDSASSRRMIYAFADRNANNSANDAGESAIVADGFNASGIPVGAPLGVAFDARGYAYIANSSTGASVDAVYRLVDLDGDGLFMSAGEITEYVGAPAFGAPVSSAYNPAEIVFVGNVGYMRNSGSGSHGVYRFEDVDGSGRADDPGEFTGFWDSSSDNASGLIPAAGFALEVDHARPRSFYTVQVASGGVDQLVRITDLDGNGSAHSPGEAVIAFSSDADGFTAVDVLSLADGRVLLSDSAGVRIIVLTDNDGDGLFLSDGEAADLLAGVAAIGTIRQFAVLPCPGDWNLDLSVNSGDISGFLTDWLEAASTGTPGADVTLDGVTNSGDISAFLTIWLAGVQGGC